MSGLVYFSGCWQDNLIKTLFHVRVKLRPSCLQDVGNDSMDAGGRTNQETESRGASLR